VAVKVRVLGTAAGGGWPQWNCACATCDAARRERIGRTQDCVAVSGDGTAWYLLNASPDLRAQLLATPELTPKRRRETPLRGVLLSTAELDHTLGLLTLREADHLTVYASAPVLAALATSFPVQRIVAGYATWRWQRIVPGTPVALDGGLDTLAIPIGSKRPRYADASDNDASDNDASDNDDWVVAYRIHDPRTGGVLLYAPCLPAWTDAIASAVAGGAGPSNTAGADLVLLDGTFLHEDEMVRATGHGPPASAMGHLPVTASLPLLPRDPDRRYRYTHLNNTNPLATPDAGELAPLASTGAGVAADGDTFEL
jgi:pyrroloquinoline quinone biosynthesis protein B